MPAATATRPKAQKPAIPAEWRNRQTEIKVKMTRHGVTTVDLAESMGVNRTYLSNILNSGLLRSADPSAKLDEIEEALSQHIAAPSPEAPASQPEGA